MNTHTSFQIWAKAPSKLLCSCIVVLLVVLAYTPAAFAQTCTPAPVNLVSWWSADGNALDSRSRHNGTLQNGANFAAGNSGQGFSFDGADDFVAFPTANFQSIRTMEFWLKTTISNQSIIDGGPGFTTWRIEIEPNGKILYRHFRNGGAGGYASLTGITTVTDGQFYHIVTQSNSLAKTLEIFVNGALDASYTETDPSFTSWAGAAIGDIKLGKSDTQGLPGPLFFNGIVDEFGSYDRILTTSEILAVFNAGTAGKCKPTATVAPSGQVGWWSGDGNANDIAGTNNGTLQNGATFAVGKVGQGFSFDGDDDFVSVANNGSLDFGTGNFSIEFWANLNDLTTDQTIFQKLSGTGSSFNDPSYFVEFNPPNGLRFRIQSSFANSNDLIIPNLMLTAGQWFHVVAVRNGNTNQLFLNGVSIGSQTAGSNLNTGTGGTTDIGKCVTSSCTRFVNGKLDEVSLYNRALTDPEITSIFSAGLAGKLKQGATGTGTNVVTNIGSDATLNFSNVSTAGTTQQIPLDPALLPALPLGFTSTGLSYDIATTAGFTGNGNVCFNLPSINSQPTFSQLKVLHLESGTWIDRTTGQNFTSRTLCGQVSSFSPFAIAGGSTPTSAGAVIGGRVTTPDGTPLGGVLVTLSGAKSAWTLTDSKGNYRFDSVDTDNFYTVTPGLANYSFSPANRPFSLLGNKTDAGFTAVGITAPVGNAIDTSEYFVRQQYLDFLGREPDQGGLEYWNQEIGRCGNDAACINSRRIDVSASFFMAKECQETGSFVYGLYKASFGNQPSYKQFIADRAKVVGGPDLDERKNALAEEWVQRDSFRQAYPDSMTSEQFVNKLFESAGLIPHTGEWETYVLRLNSGSTRAQVLRMLTENAEFTAKEYNATFVLMEYFAYLKRDPDPGGYAFWLNVLNNREPGNFRGMVCSFITSIEYQQRFSSVVSRSNAECGQ